MQIDSANTQIELSVGNTQVTLDKAIHIRRTLKRKLDSASDLINNSSGNVDIHSFLTQRDAFYEEFLMLDKTIKMLEWSATLD